MKGSLRFCPWKEEEGDLVWYFLFVRAPAVSDHKEEEKVRIRSTVVAKWRGKSSTKKEGRDKKAPLYNRVTCISRKGNSQGLQVYPLFHAFFVPAVQHESGIHIWTTQVCVIGMSCACFYMWNIVCVRAQMTKSCPF